MNVNSRERIENLERNHRPLRPNSCPDFEKEDAEDFFIEEKEEEVHTGSKNPSEETQAQLKSKWSMNVSSSCITLCH